MSYFFDLDVFLGSKRIARTTIPRGIPRFGFDRHMYTVSKDGFAGQFFTPHLAGRNTAILLLGGSEGGTPNETLPELLAAHGYPTLALAYFGSDGLPATLTSIPLEYFRRALIWLQHQPLVDAHRILVFGRSRGSEAALLIGSHYRDLVRGVLAAVPTNAVHCARRIAPPPQPVPSSWTIGGHPLPCTRTNTPMPVDDPAALIPVENINGPVFAFCAGKDTTWPSCPYSEAIMARLTAHHHSWADVLREFSEADHGIGFATPYLPFARDVQADPAFVADEHARATVWPQVLNFLASFGQPAYSSSATPTS